MKPIQLRFTIPFNRDIYLHQVKLILPLAYKKYFKEGRETLLVGLISTLIGILILMDKSYLGNVFIVLGFVFIIKAYLRFQLYYKLKNESFENVRQQINEGEFDSTTGIFEFNDDTIIYIYNDTKTETDWKDFKKFKIIDSNLLLVLNQEEANIMAIGENEIGKENFSKLIDFVKSKI
ncbi:hypothetical protein [Tenacibaculum sp. 190524A05c]|uniref:hypothetical protein n=1 Tax=Tenacibaculum platacis TaxID=3137852 RepID=UPI0032B192A6